MMDQLGEHLSLSFAMQVDTELRKYRLLTSRIQAFENELNYQKNFPGKIKIEEELRKLKDAKEKKTERYGY